MHETINNEHNLQTCLVQTFKPIIMNKVKKVIDAKIDEEEIFNSIYHLCLGDQMGKRVSEQRIIIWPHSERYCLMRW